MIGTVVAFGGLGLSWGASGLGRVADRGAATGGGGGAGEGVTASSGAWI